MIETPMDKGFYLAHTRAECAPSRARAPAGLYCCRCWIKIGDLDKLQSERDKRDYGQNKR